MTERVVQPAIVLRPARTAIVPTLLLFLAFAAFLADSGGLLFGVAFFACLGMAKMSKRILILDDALEIRGLCGSERIPFSAIGVCACRVEHLGRPRSTCMAEFLWPLGLSDWALEKGWGFLVIVRDDGRASSIAGFTPDDAELIRKEIDRARMR